MRPGPGRRGWRVAETNRTAGRNGKLRPGIEPPDGRHPPPKLNEERSPAIIPIPSDRLPPYNLDAEQAVLGAMLRDDSRVEAVRGIVRPGDFYRTAHEVACRAIFDLNEAGKPVDGVIFAAELERRGEYDRVGGDEFYGEIMDAAPHSASVEYHAGIVREKSLARGLIEAANQTLEDCYSGRVPIDGMIASADRNLGAVRSRYEALGAPTSLQLSEFEPTELRWLWPGRVPLGKLTTFAGPGGLGKSFVTLDMAARISTGEPWPDSPNTPNPPGSVVLISSEDDLHDTTVPRLLNMGADLTAIRTLSPEELARFTLASLAPLERTIAECDRTRLVVIDPPTAHLGDTDDHKNGELRALLKPLADLAARHEVAIIMVTHVNKSSSASSAGRVMGSVAWTNVMRAAWLFKKDDDDKARRLVLPIKTNLAPDPTGLAYRLDRQTGRVAWETETLALDADEACAAEGRNGSAGSKVRAAAEWLQEYLADFARASERIFADGKAAGFTTKSLYTAKRSLGIRAKPKGHQGAWHWGLGDPELWTLDPFDEDGDPPTTH